jgi:hypothetical protein
VCDEKFTEHEKGSFMKLAIAHRSNSENASATEKMGMLAAGAGGWFSMTSFFRPFYFGLEIRWHKNQS